MNQANTIALAVLLIGGLGGLGVWASTSHDADRVISQKMRMFNPGVVDIKRGDALVFVNDDADLLHHAYVDSDDFSFDSGDQQPGSRTREVFPVAGTFNVLCGIHPKMKLVVHVR